MRFERWRFGGDARIFRQRTLWSSKLSDIGVNVARSTLSLWACHATRSARFELAPCLSATYEHVALEGVGASVSSRRSGASSLGFGGGGSAYFYLGDWVALVGTATLELWTKRPRLVVEGAGEVRQLGVLDLGATLGAEWIF